MQNSTFKESLLMAGLSLLAAVLLVVAFVSAHLLPYDAAVH